MLLGTRCCLPCRGGGVGSALPFQLGLKTQNVAWASEECVGGKFHIVVGTLVPFASFTEGFFGAVMLEYSLP